MESVVQVTESCLVAPREATPTEGLWLSPIDLVVAKVGHSPLVCLYRSGGSFFDVARLKEAMAKALVAYYPLAGRLGLDNDGRVEINCTGEGALFAVARSRCLTAQDVDFTKPSPELSMFLPSIEPTSAPPMLATQVTFLRCGAVVLGVSVHRVAADGISTSRFMQTWSALYRDDGSTVPPPCHDRTLLRARSPPVVLPDALFYYPEATLLPSSSNSSGPTVTEAFPISRDRLKRLCGGSGGAASIFVSLSALVWQCMTVIRRLPPDAIMRLSFPVHVQRYVRPPLPARYFGNAAITLCATGAAGDIASEPFPSIAARISGAMARMDDEQVRSAVNYMELADKNTWPRRGNLPETDLFIVSWLNLKLGLDLGCGGPQAMTPAMTRADTIRNGPVHLIDYGPAVVCVVVHMEAANIKEFQRLLYASIAKQASRL